MSEKLFKKRNTCFSPPIAAVLSPFPSCPPPLSGLASACHRMGPGCRRRPPEKQEPLDLSVFLPHKAGSSRGPKIKKNWALLIFPTPSGAPSQTRSRQPPPLSTGFKTLPGGSRLMPMLTFLDIFTIARLADLARPPGPFLQNSSQAESLKFLMKAYYHVLSKLNPY
jgi:hypothetical protein